VSATFLLRAWQHTGDDRYGKLAARAAVAIRRTRWHAGTAQCHGLAGDAEFLLDLAEDEASGGSVIGDPARYRAWARDVVSAVYARHVLRDGRLLVPDESAVAVVPDFGTGLSGVLALLLRMRDGGPRMWLPGVLTPAAPSRPASSPQTAGHPEPRCCSTPAMAMRGGETHGTRH